MTGSNSGTSVPRSWKSLVAVAALLAMPLSGCMSSGSSTFANSFDATGSVRTEANSMQAIPLDVVASHRRRVEQYVHVGVVEEVDLIDVEDAPVCTREQSRLERLAAGMQCPLDVE